MGLVLSHRITTKRRGVNIYEIKEDKKTRIAELRVASFKKTLDEAVVEIDFTNIIDDKRECEHYSLRKQEEIAPMRDLIVCFAGYRMEETGTWSLKFLYDAPLKYHIVRTEIDKGL